MTTTLNKIPYTFIKGKQHKTVEGKSGFIDLGMHTDDIATVAVLSGLKWIEPSFLYAISSYKSGIRYRN